MAFNASVNLGTVGNGITGQTVSISGCTGPSCASGCSSLATSQAVSSFPKTISGIPDGTLSLFVKVDGGDCSGTNQCISITGLPGATPTPTSTATPTSTIGATPTSTPTLTGTPTLTSTPTLTGTSTITPTVTTSAASGKCYSLTYTNGNSIDLLSVRYRNMSGTIVTEALNTLEATSNGDGSTSLLICVQQGQSYATPVCVQGGIEVTCDPFEWVQGGNCTTVGNCTAPEVNVDPITFTATPSCVGYAPTGVTITIGNVAGGTGTGYYVVMTSGGDTTPHNLPYAYTGLNNYVGNTYAFSVYDSFGNVSNNVALTEGYSCAAAPNNTAVANLVIQSTKPNSSQCSSGTSYTFDLGSPSATFCNATTYTASGLTGLGTGNNYWLCYEGQTKQVFHPSNAGYFQSAGGCQTV